MMGFFNPKKGKIIESQAVQEKIRDWLDQLAEEFTTGDFYSAVHAAKLEFFSKTGKISDDDKEFEVRMNQFLDWYLFDRDLPGIDLPPVRYFIRENGTSLGEEDYSLLENITKNIHSIFEVKKESPEELLLQDLFSKKKFSVPVFKHTPTMTKAEIFEGRLIPHKNGHYLSSGICFHPAETRGFITSEIKKIRHMDRSQHRKLILKLADMKLKHARYNHIHPKFIYSESPSF